MAKRLATEYVKTCLRLSEADMRRLIQLFREQRMSVKIQVCENGNQEMVLSDESGDEISLVFVQRANFYVLEGTFRIRHAKLTDVMRMAVSAFKGDAVVHRLYPAFTMIYEYERGAVAKIVEQAGGKERVIYEFKKSRWEQLWKLADVENEISEIHEAVDRLLDMRNLPAAETAKIDAELTKLAKRLFVLEA
ncbi:MAG TPA: non-ribosomal peptide synthetase module [Bacilli bacterium]